MSEKVTDIDAGRPHLACVALCSVCTHEWAAVLPESAKGLPLECPFCHQMAGQIEHVPFLPKVVHTNPGSDEGRALRLLAFIAPAEHHDRVDDRP